jgi:hypothetical protein
VTGMGTLRGFVEQERGVTLTRHGLCRYAPDAC